MLRPAEGGLLWRTAKIDVLPEISLPQQNHRMTYLTLNAVERHFYMAQHKVDAGSYKCMSSCMLAVDYAMCMHLGKDARLDAA